MVEFFKIIKNRSSLTISLALTFLALSTIVLVISNSLNIYFGYKNQRKVIDVQQQLIAQKAASSVKGFIDDKINLLFSAINFTDLFMASRGHQKLVLEKLLGKESSFRQLILLDTHHRELINISRVSRTVSGKLTEQERNVIFSYTSQNKPYISSIYINDITFEPMVIIAVPVVNVFGDFKGALVAEMNLKYMWDLMDQIEIGRKGYAYVVDRDGYLIAFKDIGRVLNREKLDYLQEVNEFCNGNEFIHESQAEISRGINNTFVLTTHIHLVIPDWAVVVESPIMEAYKSVFMMFIMSILVMILSLFLAVILGFFLSRMITKPIIELRDATREISKGHLTTNIQIDYKNEIGDLANNFNKMVVDLKRTTVSRNALKKEIKERKRMEVRLKEAMDNLTRSNLQYTYVASHDLQEPLRMISSYMSLLEKRYRNKLDSDAEEFIGYAVEGAERLQTLINDLLRYSRVTSQGKSFIKTNMEEVFDHVLSNLKMVIKESRVKITHDTLPVIMADQGQMIQLLWNLLDNAIKYSGSERPILHISVKRRKGEDEFSIHDNGIGIKKEYWEKIFWIFQRLHAREEYSGTGIGLAICMRIIERHEGRIWVESEIDKGSTFYFTIPKKSTRI